MKADQIVYKAFVNGYTYIYDKTGFISVFDKPYAEIIMEESDAQCVYTSQVECKSKKDFELEIIYVSQKINEL